MPHSYLIFTSLVAPGLESKNFPELWKAAERANAGWGVTGTVVFDGAIFWFFSHLRGEGARPTS